MVLTMSKGWFSLIFSELEQVNWVLTCYWHLENDPHPAKMLVTSL